MSSNFAKLPLCVDLKRTQFINEKKGEQHYDVISASPLATLVRFQTRFEKLEKNNQSDTRAYPFIVESQKLISELGVQWLDSRYSRKPCLLLCVVTMSVKWQCALRDEQLSFTKSHIFSEGGSLYLNNRRRISNLKLSEYGTFQCGLEVRGDAYITHQLRPTFCVMVRYSTIISCTTWSQSYHLNASTNALVFNRRFD